MSKTNAGYKIIKKECYNETRKECIVLGYNEISKCAPYATWEYNTISEYYWGHYYENKNDALKDYHERLAYYYNKPF